MSESEGSSEKENKRVGDNNIELAPKRSKSVTTSLAYLSVTKETENYISSGKEDSEELSKIEDNNSVMTTVLFGDPNPNLDVPAVYSGIPLVRPPF